MRLNKLAALEYMANRGRRVTAKELAIDLDSRASTASELLERMTAQGLLERDRTQRPRQYGLTEAGHALLRSLRQGESAASNASDLTAISTKLDSLANQLTSFKQETADMFGDLVQVFMEAGQ